MKIRNRFYSLLTSGVAALAFYSPSVAADDPALEYAKEVEACVDGVNARLSFADASRVRHTVYQVRETVRGFHLAIHTKVYRDTDTEPVRRYEVQCITRTRPGSIELEIDEQIARTAAR